MLKVLPMAGGAVLLFLLIIIAAVISSSNRKKRQGNQEYEGNINRNRDEITYESTVSLKNQNKVSPLQERLSKQAEDDFGIIPKLDREQREEIAALAQMNKGMETGLLGNDVSSGNKGETALLSSCEDTDFYAVLQCREGEAEKEFKMTSAIINVGRDPETSDFVISSDSYVGRNHAVVYFEQGKFYVKDLSSRNGTFVNGKRITEASEIDNGSIIRFANTDVTFKVNV
jgi:hypothetical protein